MVGEAVEEVAHEDGVDVGVQVITECARTAAFLEDAANPPVEFSVVLAQGLPCAGGESMFETGRVVSVSTDRNHVPDELLELALWRVDDP